MCALSREDARQGLFVFDGDDRAAVACDCFHGRIPGVFDGSRVLTCGEAPWWCPKRFDSRNHAVQIPPPVCNTGAGFDDVDPD